MADPYLTKRLERTVDGILISVIGGRVENERILVEKRTERGSRSETQFRIERRETRHEVEKDGRWGYSHSTLDDERVPEQRIVGYDHRVAKQVPVYDVRLDDGGMYRELHKGLDAVIDGDSLIIVNCLHVASGQQWARWFNVSRDREQVPGRRHFEISQRVQEEMVFMRVEVELAAREAIAGRGYSTTPGQVSGDINLIEGDVVEIRPGGRALVEFAGVAIQEIDIPDTYAMAAGDLIHVIARLEPDAVGTIYLMSNPVTWRYWRNNAALAAMQPPRTTRAPHMMGIGGLGTITLAIAGLALGWPAIGCTMIGAMGLAMSGIAALTKRLQETMAQADARERERMEKVVDDGHRYMAHWTWRRIREGL